MSMTSAEIMEIAFNILYLITIWCFVAIMLSNRKKISDETHSIAMRLLVGFLLLAIGDTGHVGFRVIAFALGGLEANALLVGLGALSTAITVGILYMLILEIWRIRYSKPRNLLYYIILGAGILRYIIMIFPQNQWGSVVPPFGWSLARNVPLMLQGIGVAILIFQDARVQKDKVFTQFAWCIFVSYAFYTPVILFVQVFPMIGMLMIPKTLAYLAMAWISLKNYFLPSALKKDAKKDQEPIIVE